MKRLTLILTAPLIALALPGMAAPPEHAGGPGGNPSPPGQAAESGASPSPSAPAQSGSGSPPSAQAGKKAGQQPGASGDQGVPSDQDAAQRAVQRREALPLSKIIGIARKQTAGRVINARLLRVSGVLLYQLTILDGEGRSWRDYYLAASGNPVVLP